MTMYKEILALKKLMDKQADKSMLPILRAYKKALNEVRTDIGKIYVKYAVDGVLNVSRQQRYHILRELGGQLVKQAKTIGLIDLDHTTKILEDVYTQSYYQTAFTIDKGVDVAINFAKLKPEMVKAAVNMPLNGNMFSDRIWKNKELLVNRVRQSVEKAMTQGTSIDKLARDITKNFGSSAYESKRLIHTEVARCQSLAQDEIYKESGVVQEVLFDATLDDRTSEICQGFDGKRFPLNNHPNIPEDTHPNCRSAIIPIVPGWNPTKKRENVKVDDGKPIIDYQNYESWKMGRGID